MRKRRRFVRRRSFRRFKQVRPRPEIKTADVAVGGALTDTPAFFLLNGTDQGIVSDQRIGVQVRAKSIQARFTIKRNEAQTGFSQVLVILLVDRSTNSTAPTGAELLDIDVIPMSYPSTLNMARFHTIRRWFFSFNPDSTTSPVRKVNVFKKLNFRVDYSGVLDTVGHMNRNGIFLFTLSDTTINDNTIDFRSRFRYTDA